MTSLTDALAALLTLAASDGIQSVMLTNTDRDGFGEDGCGAVFPGVAHWGTAEVSARCGGYVVGRLRTVGRRGHRR